MNQGGLKNMVVLKNLPSNIVEEAIIVLKQNQKTLILGDWHTRIASQRMINYYVGHLEKKERLFLYTLEKKNPTKLHLHQIL